MTNTVHSSWLSAPQYKWVIYLGHYSSMYSLLCYSHCHTQGLRSGNRQLRSTTQAVLFRAPLHTDTPLALHTSLQCITLENTDPPIVFSLPFIWVGLENLWFFYPNSTLSTHDLSPSHWDTPVVQRFSGSKKGRQSFLEAQVKLLLNKINRQAKNPQLLKNPATPLFSKSKSHLHDEWKIFLLYKAKFSLGSSLIWYIHKYTSSNYTSFILHISPKSVTFPASLEALTLHISLR